MSKFLIVVVVVMVLGLFFSKEVEGGYPGGNYGLGYGFIAGGGYPHYHSPYYPYRPAIAKVQHHQTPFNYLFSVNEQGKGYQKYHYQTADTHHVLPVAYAGAFGGYGYGK